MNNLISINDINKDIINNLLELALYYRYPYNKKDYKTTLKDVSLINIFFENSTRTSLSFQKAILNLGGNYLHYDVSRSSINKGESLNDTIRTIENYADIIVMRHSDNDIFDNIKSKKLLINAGNGTNEHPTQSLTDLLTIYYCNNKNIDCFNNLNITIVGDLRYGRTVNSLIKILLNFNNVTFNLISFNDLRLSNDLKKLIINKNCKYNEDIDYKKYINNTDVLYMTRLQKERLNNHYLSEADYYNLDIKDLKNVKKKFIILHPFPRNSEINTNIDSSKYAKYFLQSELAVYMRMAILSNYYFKNRIKFSRL